MFLILMVGIPVILVNMLLQSLVAVWCIRFYIKRFNQREGILAGRPSITPGSTSPPWAMATSS